MKRLVYLGFMVLLVFSSCNRDDRRDNEPRQINVNQEFYKLMKKYYYWSEHIPEINPDAYDDPYELLEAIRYYPPDRWSYVTTRSEFEAYYNESSYVGFGFAVGATKSNQLIISFVFDSSPIKADGVDRGWEILTIDGQKATSDNYDALIGGNVTGMSKTFEFKSPADGSILKKTYTKAQIATNTVFADTVYTLKGSKVGYFMLKSFINPTAKELDEAFNKFKSLGVNELIVDLRYNGGGLVDVSLQLANMIGSKRANGGVFGAIRHNKTLAEEMDDEMRFSPPDSVPNALDLNRVYFITTRGSASASELVINSLKPFMDVKLVGTATHGKPVGMYMLHFTDPTLDWAFVPICFSIFNANGQGDYFDGLPADIAADDDIYHAFGDIHEGCLHQALLDLGLVAGGDASKRAPTGFKPLERSGLYGEIGAY